MTRQLQLSFDASTDPPRAGVPPRAGAPPRAEASSYAVLLRGARDRDLERDRAQLEARLGLRLGLPVRVVLGSETETVRITRTPGALLLRLSAAYLGATSPRIHALVQALREALRGSGAEAGARPRRMLTRGMHHDLLPLLREVAHRYFDGRDDVRITWGRRSRRSRRGRQRSVQLGVYVAAERLIRIHPVLDQAWIPRFYVSSIVFHEMLHHVLPAKRVGGRYRYHTPEFRRLERAFEDHERAQDWERRHLDRLLRGG
ncbi:MAG: hypothetical protein OEY14_06845 [Myxococcales bacterium]|nr:hypothetical protein [Myxococcales bacterium]